MISTGAGGRLWRNRNFNIFWAGQSLSVMGDAFGFLALPLLVLQATGSVAQMGLVTATFGVGQVVAGLFSGALVDRVDRRRLMMGCDLGRAALYATIPLAWWLLGPQLWLLYVVTALVALLGNIFGVSYITALPNLVDKDQLTDANARLETSFWTMFLVGPALAGFVSYAFGPAIAIGVDALSFLLSALSLLFVRLRLRSGGPEVEKGNPLQEFLAGARFLMREPVLRSVALLLAPLVFLTWAGTDLFIYYLKNDLRQDDNAIGILFGVSSLGGIVGGLLAPAMRRRWGFAVCWLGAGLLEGVALAAVGPAPGVLFIGVFMMFFFFANTVRAINSMSLRQEITPDHLLGRVTSAFWLIMMVPGPLGAALMTALAEQIGSAAVFVLMGLGAAALSAIGLFTPIWTGRQATDEKGRAMDRVEA